MSISKVPGQLAEGIKDAVSVQGVGFAAGLILVLAVLAWFGLSQDRIEGKLNATVGDPPFKIPFLG